MKGFAKGYSLLRAINDAASKGGLAPSGGLEREVSDEIAQRTGRTPKGFFVPLTVGRGGGKRDSLPTLDIAKGAGSLAPLTAYGSFLDALRSRMVCGALGARLESFGGERGGGVDLPMIDDAGAVQWVGDGKAPTEPAGMTTGRLELRPHTVTGYTDLTRKMRHSSTPEFESYVLTNLARGLASEVDRVALVGTGEEGEPEGLSTLADPYTITEGSFSRSSLVGMERAIGNDNADGTEAAMGLATSPNGRALMREMDLGGGRFLWGDDGRVLGYPALATTALSDELEGEPLIFGDWSNLVINTFGGVMDLIIDRLTFSTSGTVRLLAFLEVDVQVAYSDAFRAAVIDY